MRFLVSVPPMPSSHQLSISPDGRWVAFVAAAAGKRTLFVRAMDSTTAQPLVEIDSTNTTLFWSPDSRDIVFASSRGLKKVEVSGGPPQNMCDLTFAPLFGTWNRDGVILVGSNQGLYRLSASGCEAVARHVPRLVEGRTRASGAVLPAGWTALPVSRVGRRRLQPRHLCRLPRLHGTHARAHRLVHADLRGAGLPAVSSRRDVVRATLRRQDTHVVRRTRPHRGRNRVRLRGRPRGVFGLADRRADLPHGIRARATTCSSPGSIEAAKSPGRSARRERMSASIFHPMASVRRFIVTIQAAATSGLSMSIAARRRV